MAIEKVLVVDDEPFICNLLAETLRRINLEVTTAENGQQALQMLKSSSFDLVITDLKMPELTGIDLLRKVKEITPKTLVVILTAYGSIENAVEAMRLGAFNYLMKPFSTDTLEMIVGKAQEHLSLIEENQSLRQQISSHSFPKIIGESPSMKKILEEVNNVATSHASVFITGESGTGKEVIAHAIHHHSPRKSHPFIKVNCAAIPEALMESEFFGHEKGAFTGASTRHLGRFELANKGTLLLDEVTEIPSGLQAKLLRVTQEQEFDRVGGSKPIKVDVRLISTSNRNIRETLQKKILREDLFYRLNVIPIHIPPLRERREDIIPLAEFFIEKMCLDNHKEKKTLSQEAKDKLLSYAWPGNVRELANIIERAVVTYSSNKISPEQLILEGQLFPLPPPFATSLPIGMTLQELEKQLIIETLHTHQNNKTKTAAILGISLNTLQTKLNKYQLKID